MINLHRIVLLHHPTVVQVLVDLVFSNGMLDIVVLDLLTPVVVEVVDLAGYFPAVLKIEGLVDLRIAAFSEDAQNEVPVFKHSKLILRVYAAVLAALFVSHPLIFLHVDDLLLLEKMKLLSNPPLLIFIDFEFELVYLLLLVLINIVEF